ncbi:MAG: thermonuclease family protein [Thaumarchaeota archaeon]|nr:MAG: thermonuclease family protein [Nitrososphaerota archaeon]
MQIHYSLSACRGHVLCFAANITKAVDGDSIDINDTRIRLSLVDTPEIGHKNYTEAKNYTLELCPVGSIGLVDQDDDQSGGSYGRMISLVYCEDPSGNFTKSLNEFMLKRGYPNILPKIGTKSDSSESWTQEFGCKEFVNE